MNGAVLFSREQPLQTLALENSDCVTRDQMKQFICTNRIDAASVGWCNLEYKVILFLRIEKLMARPLLRIELSSRSMILFSNAFLLDSVACKSNTFHTLIFNLSFLICNSTNGRCFIRSFILHVKSNCRNH